MSESLSISSPSSLRNLKIHRTQQPHRHISVRNHLYAVNDLRGDEVQEQIAVEEEVHCQIKPEPEGIDTAGTRRQMHTSAAATRATHMASSLTTSRKATLYGIVMTFTRMNSMTAANATRDKTG